MDAADDVTDHRLGGVINSAPLAGFGVVFRQERLVKMQNGVIAFALAVVPLQDGLHIGGVEDGGDVVHDDFHL
ncbi:hypothetical protein HRbin09_02068 [bacterium HR09]|nr:hypothetical protein HRbin09_02068 [bacterium HR09]